VHQPRLLDEPLAWDATSFLPAERDDLKALSEASADCRGCDLYRDATQTVFGEGRKPNAREIRACKPWLLSELDAIQPDIVVCLGATAAQAMLGPAFRVTQQRGQSLAGNGVARYVVATVHRADVATCAHPLHLAGRDPRKRNALRLRGRRRLVLRQRRATCGHPTAAGRSRLHLPHAR